MSTNAWQTKGAIFAPENQQGLRSATALTDVLYDAYVVYEMSAEWIVGSILWVKHCQRLQVFASKDQQYIGFLWTPARGRKIRTKLVRDRNNYNLPPRIIVFHENVVGWKPKTGEIVVQPIHIWNEVLEKIPSSQTERTKLIAFEMNSGVTFTAPTGTKNPPPDPQSHDGFARDAAVRRWALERAEWRCETCGAEAPFITESSEPYLEVHHLHQLADGGPDTPENVAALCPNCHREIHYGVGASDMRRRLRQLRES